MYIFILHLYIKKTLEVSCYWFGVSVLSKRTTTMLESRFLISGLLTLPTQLGDHVLTAFYV